MKHKSPMDHLSGSTKKSDRKRGGMVNASAAGLTIKGRGGSFFSRSGRRGGSAIMDLIGALFDRFAPVVPLKRDIDK